MSRFPPPRGYDNGLAYGDSPQRWDRDRFERFGRGPTSPRQFEEDYRYQERDGPGRRDVAVADRIDTRGPRGRFEERDRYYEHDRLGPDVGPRRRTDRELFGDTDPREVANMAMTPYRAKSSTRNIDIDIDIDRNRGPAAPRPGLLRRQSSLDTFDRRAPPRHGYEREDYRMAPYNPVPLPYRRDQRFGDEYERERYRDYEQPEDYREVEIQRERSVHRHRPKSHKSAKSSKAKTVTTRRSSSSSSSSSSSFQEVHKEESIHESIHGGTASVHETIDKRFKKGKTRMPKRLVRREAIMDLGYPYDEEADFFVLRIALEKEQIDEVMRISESYKSGEKKTVYEYKEKIDEAPAIFPPPEPAKEHEEIVRTEWINPPSVAGARTHRSVSHSGRRSSSRYDGTTPRGTSPARTERSRRTSHSRHRSSPGQEFFERKTVVEEHGAPPPPPPPAPPVYYEDDRRTQIVEERVPMSPPSNHGTLVLQEREYRSDRDINGEIAKLEAERRALRLEREADERRDMAIRIRERPEEEYQLVEYRDRPTREVLEVVERDRSPPRNVLRVEKDRKGRMAMVRSKN